jgi:hypothetical protein
MRRRLSLTGQAVFQPFAVKIHRICGDLAPAPQGGCSFRGTCQKLGTSGVSVTAAAVELAVSDRTKNGVVDNSGEKHRTGSIRIRRVPLRLFGYCEGPVRVI